MKRASRRWWTRRDPFLRSIGFEIPFIFGLARNTGEEPRAIVQTSRALALARCGIHILPVLVSITILSLNLGNSYLGRGLPGSIIDPSINIALLQVAAKLQELLIVASVTVIVMHVLRSELISGEGLPLGLVAGGFLYTCFSYFWSPEFCGSFYSKFSLAARCRVYGIIVLGGLVASFAGPSTAVLLIPREQQWPAGGTAIYMPGPTQHWWPSTINESGSGATEFCNTNSFRNAICPGEAYTAVWDARNLIDILGQKTYIQGRDRNLTTGFSFGPSTVDVPSNLALLPSLRYHGNHRGYACETSTWGPRVAEAMLQTRIKQDWIDEAFAIPYNFLKYGPSLSQYKYFGSMEMSTRTRIPAVRAACLAAQILPYSNNAIQFPNLPESSCWMTTNASYVEVTELNQTATEQLRATWVALPGSASGGLIVELPSIREEGSRAVVGCSLDARWTDGSITTYHLEDASSLEKIARQIVVSTALLQDPVPASSWVPGYSDFEPVATSSSSSKITLNTSWLHSLTPTYSSRTDDQSMNTLESILDDLGFFGRTPASAEASSGLWNEDIPGKVNRTVALEWWLALLVTDGLARFGTSEILDMTGPPTEWSLLNYEKTTAFRDQLFSNKNALVAPNITAAIEERVTVTIGGYSYKASSITDYASAAVLLTHILMALAHTIYTVWWTSRSSSSWDSLTELMVLMQNSKPADIALRNASAGISDLRTYSRRARVVATKTSLEETGESKVELIFHGDDDHFHVNQGWVQDHTLTGNVPRNRRLESVNSKSPLLADTEFATLHRNSMTMHSRNDSSTNPPRRWVLERVRPDVRYR